MTRRIFYIGTALFWLVVATLAVGAWLAPSAPVASAPTKVLSLAEVARHSRADDCWMVIGGTVYDISAYVSEHPSQPSVILPWCGKEATEAYQTKTKGRAHSAQANQLLAQFAIGSVP